MKDHRFYIDFKSPDAKRKAGARKNITVLPEGATCAVLYPSTCIAANQYRTTGLGAVYGDGDTPNLCHTDYCQRYIHESMKKISEAQARLLHPNLFKVLASYPQD